MITCTVVVHVMSFLCCHVRMRAIETASGAFGFSNRAVSNFAFFPSRRTRINSEPSSHVPTLTWRRMSCLYLSRTRVTRRGPDEAVRSYTCRELAPTNERVDAPPRHSPRQPSPSLRSQSVISPHKNNSAEKISSCHSQESFRLSIHGGSFSLSPVLSFFMQEGCWLHHGSSSAA